MVPDPKQAPKQRQSLTLKVSEISKMGIEAMEAYSAGLLEALIDQFDEYPFLALIVRVAAAWGIILTPILFLW